VTETTGAARGTIVLTRSALMLLATVPIALALGFLAWVAAGLFSHYFASGYDYSHEWAGYLVVILAGIALWAAIAFPPWIRPGWIGGALGAALGVVEAIVILKLRGYL